MCVYVYMYTSCMHFREHCPMLSFATKAFQLDGVLCWGLGGHHGVPSCKKGFVNKGFVGA